MKNKNLLLLMLPLLAITISSCNGDKGKDSNSGKGSASQTASEPSYSFSKMPDTTKLIPQEVLDANVEINFAVYIQGQNGVINDIGNYSPDPNDKTRKYHPSDVTSIEMAPYFGAAYKFKQLAPDVKINLMYTSIDLYDQMIRDYALQNTKNDNTYPELMWGTDHVVEMLGNGYNYDLTRYSNTEYYDAYNEYFRSRFNFGGFQAGFPIAAEPWGIFVNMDTLEDYNIVMETVDTVNGLPTDDYKKWVDNFTWDVFADTVKKTTSDTHAGLSKMVEYLTSYSVPSINEQFIKNGTVDLSSASVTPTINKLLGLENELSQYCVYDYSPDAASIGNVAKPQFENAKSWLGTENFVKDEYSTFYAEAPWAVGTLSTYMTSNNELAATNPTVSELHTKIDFLPYPKLDEDSPAYTGIAVEGLTVGNQCPLGSVCTKEKQLRMDVAAYFAMFMGLDPRAFEGRSNVKYIFNDREYTGSLALPLSKRGYKFSFQKENEAVDPAKEFEDNWQYQLSLWFKIYDAYVIEKNGVKEADVVGFTNITPGLVKMLDSMYMIDHDYVSCLNFWNEPVNIPNIETDGIKDIFDIWQGRFTRFADSDTNGGRLGTDSYVAAVSAQLNIIETDINTNSAIAWSFLQENVDNYYGEGYDVTDKSFRNDYEGSKDN